MVLLDILCGIHGRFNPFCFFLGSFWVGKFSSPSERAGGFWVTRPGTLLAILAMLRTAALSHQNVHGAVHGQLAGQDKSALEPTQEGLEHVEIS